MFDSPSSTTWEARIDQVTSHIRENIAEINRAEEIAEIVDVSYETLRKRFRREQGIPIGEYIRQTRIDEARRLLIETNDPVYVICWKVGFSSDSSGIRAFKRETGWTMDAYRHEYREG